MTIELKSVIAPSLDGLVGLQAFGAETAGRLWPQTRRDETRDIEISTERKIATHAKKDVRLGASADESKDSAH